MNKKGFTLIELIAVIILIGALLTVAVPGMINLVENRKEKLYNSTVKEIKKVASQYIASHPEIISDNFTIEISTLCTDKYLSCPIINPITGEEMNGHVAITFSDNIYNYEYVEVENE